MKQRLGRDKLLDLLQPGGLLAQHLPGFEARDGQKAMMQCLLQAYESDAIALIEAGTGIGKSIAYLIPALLWAATSGERTVISTHTIPLQEQLIEKDIPLLLKVLGLDLRVTLVKGMGNYLCLRKWGDLMDVLPTLPSHEAEELLKMQPWVDALHHAQGKKSSPLTVLPSSTTWERVCADSDSCMGRSCPEQARCPFMQDRAQAQEAQVLVVNHHLLLTDLYLKQQSLKVGEGGLLPPYTRVILDEAHHLEEIARNHFAAKVAQKELFSLVGRLSGERHGRLSLLRAQLTQWMLKNKQQDQLPKELASLHQRFHIGIPSSHHELTQALTALFLTLETYLQDQSPKEVEGGAQRGELRMRLFNHQRKETAWVEQLLPAMQCAMHQIRAYCAEVDGALKECVQLNQPTFDEATQALRHELKTLLFRLSETANNLQRMQEPFVDHDHVRWLSKTVSSNSQDVSLVEAPLDMVKALHTYLFEPLRTVVLCSATLTTEGNFDFLRHQLGLTKEQMGGRKILEERHLSPFAYATQALFAIPSDLPEPGHGDFFQAAIEATWKALESSNGNALVLFTSYTMLLAVYSALKERCAARRFPLLRQGEASRSSLLAALRKNDHSILCATYSFWEGVDVVGEALRCVIIVKLPFPVPNDPLFQAQSERIQAQGRNPFLELAVPTAMIRFTQGFGRLIRNQRDRGCVICLDTRLITRSYGGKFLQSIPPCRHVLDRSSVVWQEMIQFYRKTHHLTLAPAIAKLP